MINSTGLVGSQAAKAGETPATPRANAVEINAPFNFIFMNAPPEKMRIPILLWLLFVMSRFLSKLEQKHLIAINNSEIGA
jgi:hypothetical protein